MLHFYFSALFISVALPLKSLLTVILAANTAS